MSENFLSQFVSLFSATEVPERFAVWCGISTLSSMLERRIWVDQGHYKIYPNTFIILVAESGRLRKSTAVNVAESLLKRADPGPKLIAQKITPEALISALQVIRNDDPKKLLQQSCGGVIVADELMTLINKRSYDAGLTSVLIPFYDCKDKFTYETKGKGTEEVNFSHLSLLAGSTIDSIREAIPQTAIGDGFTSRVIFIHTDKVPPAVAWTEYDKVKKETEETIVQRLQSLGKFQGSVSFSSEAKRYYIKEYERFHAKSEFYDNPHLRGYASRRHTHLVKVAMCMMAAEDGSMELQEHQISGAKTILEDVELSMPYVIDQILMTDVGSITDHVWRYIAAKGPIARDEVLKRFSHRVSHQDMSKVFETLLMSKRIGLSRGTAGSYEVIK